MHVHAHRLKCTIQSYDSSMPPARVHNFTLPCRLDWWLNTFIHTHTHHQCHMINTHTGPTVDAVETLKWIMSLLFFNNDNTMPYSPFSTASNNLLCHTKYMHEYGCVHDSWIVTCMQWGISEGRSARKREASAPQMDAASPCMHHWIIGHEHNFT